MTQSMDYTGTIKTKRLKNTGFSEDTLRKLHGRPGGRIMAIVELKVDDAHHKDDAPNHVDFTVEGVHPFTEARDEAHLRQLVRSGHAQGVLLSEDGDPAINGMEDVEPSIEKVIAAREASDQAAAADQPHEFVADDDGECALECGAPAGNPIHTVPADDTTAGPEDEDPYSFSHAHPDVVDADMTPTGAETPCGLRNTLEKTLLRERDLDLVTCTSCRTIVDFDADSLDDEPVPAGT